MNTIQISINAREEVQEIIISMLSDQGALGFEQKDSLLLAYFPEADFNSYEVNSILGDHEFSISILEEQNWNAVWESNFSPVMIEDFCGIRADFHEPLTGVEHEIIITPKMSFGTGHHATTYMMMLQMKSIDLKNKSVFDFGTGTGILCILAEKLGAEKIQGIDVDEWSIRNAKENIELNHCSKINVQLSSALPKEKFDMILANINRNVILQYLPELMQIIHEKGMILFSGLLVSDGDDILNATHDKLVLFKREEKNNWLSLLFKMK